MSAALGVAAPGANRSVTRALHVLRLLASASEALSLAEVARALDLPKSSALSLLRALAGEQFVALDTAGRYQLGVRSFEVGAAYLSTMTPARAVEPELAGLTNELGATSHFAVLAGDEVLYLAKHDPPGGALRLASSLGARLPAATTAVGKAQLAYCVPAASSSEGEGDRDGGREGDGGELAGVRRLGYAIDEGVTATGIRCVASAVFDAEGCCGAVGVSCLAGGALPVELIGARVRAAAGRASALLGGRPPAGGGAPAPAGEGVRRAVTWRGERGGS